MKAQASGVQISLSTHLLPSRIVAITLRFERNERGSKPRGVTVNIIIHFFIKWVQLSYFCIMKGIIYCYRNTINGKRYIGLTLNEKVRKNDHLRLRGNSPYFKKALLKYGKDNFEYIVLYEEISEDRNKLISSLKLKEVEYINKYNTNHKELGYNLTKGGEGTLGYKRIHSEETKVKISNALKGRKLKPLSNETKLKISRSKSSLTEEEVINIIKLLKIYRTCDIVKMLGISRDIIKAIKNNYSWKHIPRDMVGIV